MIERVAKAIATALGYEVGDWRDFELHARAALGEVERAREEALVEAEKAGMHITRKGQTVDLPDLPE